ncbi:MAG: carbohydrate-binding protein [Lentimonas sp.]
MITSHEISRRFQLPKAIQTTFSTLTLTASLLALSTQAHAQFTFTGATGDDWNTGANWTHSTNAGEVPGALLDQQAVIPGGQTVTLDANVPNVRALRVGDGSGTATLNILPGADVSFTTSANWDSSIGRSGSDGVVNQSGGDITINFLELGRDNGVTGRYYLSDGLLNISRGGKGTISSSLIIGTNDSSTGGGTGDGLMEIIGGTLTTRAGIWMGGTNGTASAVFSVIGSSATEIGIGTTNTATDGNITVNDGAIIRSKIDYAGLTKIFIDDHGNGNTFATFEAGSLLDVGYFNSGLAGTWTVLELENGAITDNGLAFAPGVDNGIWTFNIDNTGTNGLLTVTSTGATVTTGTITWDGSEDTNYHNGLNWDNDTGPFTAGDHAYINSGTVTYASGTTPNLRSLRMLGGDMTVSGGSYLATFHSSQHSIIDGTFYQTGGTVHFNQLEIGRDSAADGAYYLSGGDMSIARALGDNSIYLGGNHDNNASGTGLLEITAGSLKTRRGAKLGHATVAGTGTFTVLGNDATEIGIGSQGSLDGSWEQHSGSTLKVGIGYSGVTKIFIDDVQGTNDTYATFESGSLLDVDYYAGGSGGGTWIVMEVENGDITDNGLVFAPGVDTDIWSFNIDNSGSSGVLTVTATGNPNGIVLTVGNTLKQQMRYGVDYERLWFWSGTNSEKDKYAQWSVDDCDVEYIRVAMNSKYELTEGVLEENDAYWATNGNDSIIPMMQDMKDANPDIKFFASPRPLNEAVPGVAWQPYPQWITGSTGTSSNFSFDEVKCSEYLLRYLILMKHHGFKISYMDLTNEWNFVTATDYRDISALFDAYLDGTKPVIHPDYPSVTLIADDIPQLVGASAWSYSQGSSWLNGAFTELRRDAIDIVSSHNTDKGGTAQTIANKVESLWPGEGKEIWNTEVHGWKSTSNADEVLTFAYMMECINAGFSGLNGWLAIGFSNQGHCYIVNKQRSVKYYIFEKLTNTSNRGYALDVNEPSEFKTYWDPDPDQQDADSAVSALIRGNLMTVWVLNHSNSGHPTTIVPTGRTISDEPIKFTRWSQHDGLSSEGVTGSIPRLTSTSVFTTIEDNSAYCFEILLEPEGLPYTRIEAEDHDSSNSGVGTTYSTESCSDTGGGLNISNINKDTWTCYEGLDLSNATSIRLRVARPSGRAEGSIEIRTGSETGPIIGRISVPNTGDWQLWRTIEAPLDVTSGVHDVYLNYVENASNEVTSNSMFNLNWFELVLPETPATPPTGATSSPISGTEIYLSWNAVPNAIGYTVKRATIEGGPYTVIDDTITDTFYTDDTVRAGLQYYYIITARFISGESGPSAEVPAVPSDPISIESIEFGQMEVVRRIRGGDSFEFSIMNSGLGHNHQAQQNDDLTVDNWQNVGNVLLGNGGELPFVIPIDTNGTKFFYRVRIWQP